MVPTSGSTCHVRSTYYAFKNRQTCYEGSTIRRQDIYPSCRVLGAMRSAGGQSSMLQHHAICAPYHTDYLDRFLPTYIVPTYLGTLGRLLVHSTNVVVLLTAHLSLSPLSPLSFSLWLLHPRRSAAGHLYQWALIGFVGHRLTQNLHT
jgi:hypothetical protein